MSELLHDLRYALRGFRRSPLHALATILILGVGIGAVTLMFSAMNASVLRPLPYPDPDRLVWGWKAREGIPQNSLSFDDYRDYRGGVEGFDDLAAFYVFNPQVLVTGTEEAERITSSRVTANFFSVLGIPPTMGRSFVPEEEVQGGPAVVVLSHAYWQGRLGGDPAIVGQTLLLDGNPTEVVGVLPPDFSFRGDVQLWLPVQAGEGYTQGRGNNNFFFVGRLKEGVSLAQADAQVRAVTRQIQEANPDFAEWYHWLQPLHEVFFGNIRTTLFLLMGIVSLVPLVACANVASLTLARAATRSSELATRLALGARRGRVVRQLLVENLVLALAGGGLGILLAHAGGTLLRSFGPASLPRLDEIGVDPTVLAFGLLISLLTVPLFGVLPALKGTGFQVAEVLRFGGGRGGAEGRSRSRSLLVIAQVALSMVLLITSGLFLRSFLEVQKVDPGFEPHTLLTAGVQIPGHKYGSPEELALAWEQTLQRLETIPGVVGIGAADWLPVTPGGGPWNGLSRPGQGGEEAPDQVPASRKFVSAGYFDALGVPMRAGRAFGSEDRVGTEDVMVLSESLAGILFGEENPLGQPVNLWGRPFQVIGVSADVAEEGLGTRGRPTFFVAANQFPQVSFRLVIRSAADDPISMTSAVRAELRGLDRDIALSNVQTMETRIGRTLSQPRFRTGLVGSFALVGLLLAAFGLYGVLAYLVTRRQHEIGIRMALGARGEDVVGLVLRQGLGMVGVGVVIGLALGGGASVVLRNLLFGVSPADPLSLGGATVLLLAVALVASLFPARRAVRTNPLQALRSE
ncbi:MAG: ABC transporter permease [Longimicrobiales bacterium]